MDITDIAKQGLRKLENGEIGINIDAKNEEHAKYLEIYFESEGYSVGIEKPKLDEKQKTIYPVNIFSQIPLGVNQNA